MRGQPVSGCAGVGTVDDAFQSLDYLDQCGHVSNLIEGWGLQLGQQGADLLFGNGLLIIPGLDPLPAFEK